MVQAAATGAVDFTVANFRSRAWWLKARWMLDQVEDNNASRLFAMQHAQHLCVLDYSLEKQAFDSHWNAANNILRDTYELHFPWSRGSGEKRRKNEIDTLMDKWKAKFGDPNDPKVMAHYKKVADALRKRTATAGQNMFAEQKKLKKMADAIIKSRRKSKGKK